MQAYRDAMKSQKAALRSITQSDSFDEDAFLAQLASAKDLKLAVRMIQSKARYDSLSLLNDEQKIKMKKIMKKMKEKRR
jgi:Spy/CpxP family protein refolding chaperone